MKYIIQAIICTLLAFSTAFSHASSSTEVIHNNSEDWQLVGSISKPTDIFTQGLEIHQNKLWFSSGKYQASFLLALNLDDGKESNRITLENKYFAEGLTFYNDTLTVLTWKEQRALRYSLFSRESLNPFHYHGDGWGLCQDGSSFWMSNGSDSLFQRNLMNFEIESSINVSWHNQPVSKLNELECFNGWIAANQWETPYIYLINPKDGIAVYRLDLSLITAEQTKGVLNGIAWDQQQQQLLITGKYWDKVYKLKILIDLPSLIPASSQPTEKHSL